MRIPEPGTYVRVIYTKVRPGGVIGEEGEILTVSADHITLRYQGKYEGALPIKSSLAKKDIKEIWATK